MSEGSSEVIVKPLTAKFVGFAVVFAIVWSILSCFNAAVVPWFYGREFHFGLAWNGIASGAFSALLLSVLISRFLPSKMRPSPEHLVLIWAVAAGSSIGTNFRSPWVPISTLIGPRYHEPHVSRVGKFVPDFWVPTKEVIDPMFTSTRNPIPAEWILPLTFWVIFALTSYFLVASTVMIVRGRWIEIERVEYPYATFAQEICGIELGRNSSEVKAKRAARMALIGVVVGFLFYLPWLMKQIFPWLPSLYGWESWPFIPWHPGVLDVTMAVPALLSVLPGCYLLSFNPIMIALGYLLPLEVSLSTWVFWIIFLVIWPSIGYYMGIYPKDLAADPNSTNRYIMIASIDPLKLEALVQMGGFLGLAFWPIILNWRHYWDIIKVAVGLKPMEPERRASEPLHYRWILLTFVASFIILVSMLVISGLPPLQSAFFFATVVMCVLAYARVHGEGGPHPEWGWANAGWLYQPFYTHITSWETMTKEYYIMGTMGWWIGRPTLGLWSGHGNYLMNSFKLGHTFGASQKRVFLFYTLGACIGIVIAWPLNVWIRYYFGAFGLPGMSNAYWTGAGGYTDPAWAARTPYPPFYGQVLAGFLIVGFILFMRMKYLWWPFTPVGFILGVGNPQGYWGFASACLWGWILKSLTLKIGGLVVYEQYGRPFAAGLIGGIALNCLLIYIFGFLRALYII